MRTSNGVIVLVDDKMAAVRMLIAQVEIHPRGDGQPGMIWQSWPRSCGLGESGRKERQGIGDLDLASFDCG